MSLKYAILGLLDQEPHYGYEIKQKFEHMMGDLWPVSYGQLYPTLRKLAEDDLVTMKTVQGKKAVEKNVYSITDRGSEYFKNWLNDTRKKNQISIKDEFTLSLFFLDQIDPIDAEDILRTKLTELRDKHRHYTEEYQRYNENTPQYKKALTRKMLLHLEAELQWIEDLLR